MGVEYEHSYWWHAVFFVLMMRRPPRSTQSRSSAASDVYKRQDGDGLDAGRTAVDVARVDQPRSRLPVIVGLVERQAPEAGRHGGCLLYTSPSPRDS